MIESNFSMQDVLFDELGYDSPEFETPNSTTNGRSIPGIDSVFSIRNVPVAYFSTLEEYDPEQIRSLQHRVWNESKVPLLYVILPHEIRIYNGYAEPAKSPGELDQGDRLLQHLEQLKDVLTARQEIRERLSSFNRLHLETGAFWTTLDGQRIRRAQRADQHLLAAMGQVRRALVESLASEKLNADRRNEIAYDLIGSSILVRYLEDRKVLDSGWMLDITHLPFA